MKLSVIICTYNRQNYIYNVLKSIVENDFPTENYEIVLVNNNSTDNTEEECNRFKSDFPQINFSYFIERNQGLSYARNRGIAESKNEILIYVDDDATVSSNYLQAYFDFFSENKNAVAAGGPVIPVYETEEPRWMSHYTKNLITGYIYWGETIFQLKNSKYPGGGNAAYRKEIFDKIGLFNVELGRKGNSLMGAEEKDIFDKIDKLGGKYYYLPTPILYHIIAETKLTNDYFNRLTYAIGVTERARTKQISQWKFIKRIFSEGIKWGGTFVLFLFYFLDFHPMKGIKLIVFRWNVTKGLLGK